MAAIALFLTVLFVGNAQAQGTNPSVNVSNGAIWRYSTTPGNYVVDPNFLQTLPPTDVRLSQQIISDYGNGLFDVEVKAQKGSNINKVQNATVVFVLDGSGSITTQQFTQIRDACIEMVNLFPTHINAEFGVVEFSTNAIVRYRYGLTTNRAEIVNVLRTMPKSNGNTNLYDGFLKAEMVLSASSLPSGTPKQFILITDGYPNMLPYNVFGDPMLKSLEKAAELKTKGVILNVAGFGTVNNTFFDQIASSAALCKVAGNNLTELRNILVGPNGFVNSFIDNAAKNVAISMASGVTFTKVVSNTGGDYTISSPTGTLYWNPHQVATSTDVSTLVYRIQLDEPDAPASTTKIAKATKLPTGKTLGPVLNPVSSSALYNYVDATGKARSEKFDIPKAGYPVKKNTLTIKDLVYNLKGVAYDGKEHAVPVRVNPRVAYDGRITVIYNGKSSPLPKEIGDYFVSVNATETPTYYAAKIDLGLFIITPNTNLLSITITGKKSSLTLPGTQYEYDIFVPTSDNNISITATPADPSVKITGTGTYKLHPNNPTTITITVTAKNGQTTIYKLNILRVLGDGNNVIRLE